MDINEHSRLYWYRNSDPVYDHSDDVTEMFAIRYRKACELLDMNFKWLVAVNDVYLNRRMTKPTK